VSKVSCKQLIYLKKKDSDKDFVCGNSIITFNCEPHRFLWGLFIFIIIISFLVQLMFESILIFVRITFFIPQEKLNPIS
jgi:hypothetical protein